MRVSKNRRWAGLAVVLTAALVVGACGDDDDDDAGADPSAGAPALTGPPIELGLSNTENSPAGNYVDSRLGAEAAVRYVNEELGGVNGRPLELEACTTAGTPESSINCANKFVQSNKLLVSPGIDLGAPAAIPIYAQAGMPYVGGLFTSAEEYASPVSYSFIGAAAGAIAGLAAYAGQELQAKKVVVMAPDIPQLPPAIDNFVKPVLAKLGTTDITTIPEAATAPDFTPAVTRANRDNPDVIIMLFSGPTCVKVMQAVAQANVPREKVLYAGECANKAQIEAGGGGGEGATFQSALVNLDSDAPNAQVFREKLEKYSEDTAPGVTTATGFDSIMNIYSVLKKIPGEITRESLVTALKSTNSEPAFLSHGFTCDGKQFPNLPGLCDTHFRFYKYENGEFSETNNEWVNGVAVLTGG